MNITSSRLGFSDAMSSTALSILLVLITHAGVVGAAEGERYLGTIHRHTAAADEVIPRKAQMEILADGFEFSEGPVWMPHDNRLLFSDIPRNTIFQWQEGKGLSIYLRPSGYVGVEPRGGEPGTNGLLRDLENRLIMLEHGDRRVTRLDDPRGAIKSVLAERFEGKRLNSPNDGVMRSNGDLYFTDPPYGLEGAWMIRRKNWTFREFTC